MIVSNFDVSNGVVNRHIDVLKCVNYWVNLEGFRHATSCIVESDHIVRDPLPGLDTNQAVALEDEVDLIFTRPNSKKKLKIRRKQLPIQPAFAITAHKSQGMSLDRVVVDLEGCTSSESPYVMLFRVKSVDGLLILRPFQQSKISRALQQDVEKAKTVGTSHTCTTWEWRYCSKSFCRTLRVRTRGTTYSGAHTNQS